MCSFWTRCDQRPAGKNCIPDLNDNSFINKSSTVRVEVPLIIIMNLVTYANF
jgi:hypothetical protein